MIRRATLADVDAIVALENELFDNSMNERMVAHELEIGKAWLHGDPVDGYLLARETEDVLDVLRLGVTETAQGKGIGQALLTEAIRPDIPTLLTVSKLNAKALRLYRKNGFQIAGHLQAAHAWILLRPATSSSS